MNLYVIHLYHFDSFFVELRLDPIRYSILSVELFSETHPRYEQYMKKIDKALGFKQVLARDLLGFPWCVFCRYPV